VVIDFADQKIQPCVPRLGYLRMPLHDRDIYAGHVYNPNESYENDYPPLYPCPESWYLSKVYNLEVEDYHTYFVDKLGVWVHNATCGGELPPNPCAGCRTLSESAETRRMTHHGAADDIRST